LADTFASELARLRSGRRALRVGLVPLPCAVALVLFVGDAAARLAWPSEAMIGISMALVCPFGLWWAPRLLELMHQACPRCDEPFFAAPGRMLGALFSRRASCAHCALSLHATHPASGWRGADGPGPADGSSDPGQPDARSLR
jgi:hypothetical protein